MVEEVEFWREVEGWPTYQVSNLGNVLSSWPKGNTKYKIATKGTGGYYRVTLTDKKGKRTKTITVHRLVALHFVDGRDESLHVAHIDGNKSNNRASNLRWTTAKENENHKRSHGNFVAGNRSPILNIYCVSAIRKLNASGWSQHKLSDLFEVSVQTINNALKPEYSEMLDRTLNNEKK